LFVGIYWLYFLIHLFQNRSSNPCSLRIFGINIPQWCLFLLVLMTMILWSIAIHVLKFVVSTQHFPEIPR
jgi:disulfide bond formation protein DsbB